MIRRVLPLSLAAIVAALVIPGPAEAIPAFARRYRVSCTTCHAPFPRLKPYGEEYAGRGFAFEPGAEPARASIDLGDSAPRSAARVPDRAPVRRVRGSERPLT